MARNLFRQRRLKNALNQKACVEVRILSQSMKMNNSTITYLGFAIVQHAGNPTPVLDHLCAIDRGKKERIGINLIEHVILQEKATAGTLGIDVLRDEKIPKPPIIEKSVPFLTRRIDPWNCRYALI